MIALKPLLIHLLRIDVADITFRTGRPPAARVGNTTENVDARAFSTDDILQVLFATGGSRYIESLGDKPAQWRTRVEGLGVVLVTASLANDMLEAHVTLRDKPVGGVLNVAPAPATARTGTAIGDDGPPQGSRGRFPIDARPEEAPPSPRAKRQQAQTKPIRPLLDEDELDLEFELDHVAVGSAAAGRTTRPLTETEVGAELRARPVAREAASERQTSPLGRTSRPPSPETARYSNRGTPAQDFSVPGTASPRTPGRVDPQTMVPTLPPAARPGRRTTRPFSRDPRRGDFRKLLETARELGASDLHLIAGRPPLFRIAGQLVPHGEAVEPRILEDMFLGRTPAHLTETLDRDGSCDFAVDEEGLGRFRLNVSRQRTGLKASVRVIGCEIPTLAALGLPDGIEAATHHHQGLIVLTGPTGHGKTTTLAAVVDVLNRETTRHIITVEDPIEYVHPRKRAMISQREVGTHTRSFQSALKASLREDPDVIVVGELRDTETVRMALSASETGHLVIGTMNTPSAAKTIDRLIDLFPPADQQQVRMTLAGGLRLIVSQRLLPDSEGKAMVAAAEILPGTVPLWNLIRDSRTYQIPSLQQRGKALGVIRLDDSLAALVRAGRTTAAAAMAVAESPDDLETTLGPRKPSTSTANMVTAPAPPLAPRSMSDAGGKSLMERAGGLFGKKGT